MKATNGMKLLLQFDKTHDRIDLQRPAAHILTALLALGWAWHYGGDWKSLFSGLVAILTFAILVRLVLSRAGASRFAALTVLIVLLLSTESFLTSEVMVLNVAVLTVLLAQEYFVLRTKLVAVGVATAMGIVLAGAGLYADRLFLVFVIALLLRILWHAIIERMGRKAFVLFSVKAAAMVALSWGIWQVLQAVLTFSLMLAPDMPPLHVPWWLIAIGVLLALRGLWATLLLKTARSPQHRGMRLFYGFLGLGLLAVAWGMQQVGADVFLPQALGRASELGLMDYNLVISAYALLAAGLYITAGIDRSFYKDTRLARSVRSHL